MKKRVTASVFAAVMAATLMLGVTPVHAAYSLDKTTPGDTMKFTQYLVVKKGANVPNATFKYTIKAGSSKTITDNQGGQSEILAGVGADQIKMTGTDVSNEDKTVTFKVEDTLDSTEPTEQKQYITDFDSTTQEYAKKEITLDFSECGFDEPGIYRYIIEETGENQGVTLDADPKRAIDVYVDHVGDDTLRIKGYVMLTDETGNSQIEEISQKYESFTNWYATSDLTFRNEVKGSLASRDKYFKYTVKLTGATVGTKYTVDTAKGTGSNSSTATAVGNRNQANATEMVATDGAITKEFYLKHGEEITIKGIANNTKYEVTADKEDYGQEAKGVENYTDETSGTISATVTGRAITSSDIKTSYLHTRGNKDNESEGTILPTGVVMNIAPFAAAVLLGGLGAVKFATRKKEEDEEA